MWMVSPRTMEDCLRLLVLTSEAGYRSVAEACTCYVSLPVLVAMLAPLFDHGVTDELKPSHRPLCTRCGVACDYAYTTSTQLRACWNRLRASAPYTCQLATQTPPGPVLPPSKWLTSSGSIATQPRFEPRAIDQPASLPTRLAAVFMVARRTWVQPSRSIVRAPGFSPPPPAISMEPLHLHAPRATSEPLNLKRALMEWRQNLADESHSLDDTMQAPEATTSYSAAPQFQTAPPADTRSHLDEWTEAMVIVQIKLIRSKLAYFRMLLDQATLDTEQRTALQEFASELRATMEALEAKSLTGGDIASAQGVWPGSPSEEDITEMSFDSSSAGGSSSDVSLSLPPDFDVEALLSGGATRLDGSYVPSSYESSLSSQLEDALRNPATAPMFDVGASYPPQQPLQAQVGSTSYSYTLSQVQVSVSSSVYNVRSDSDSSSYAPQAIPWYMDYSQWTNVPHDDSSSECNTAATFSSASPWDTEFHMPGDFNDYNQHQQDFNSTVASNGSLPLYDVQSTASSMSFASDGATAAQFPHVDSTAQVPGWYQAREFQYAMGDGRLLAVHGMDPSSPHSWSSNMSECSIVL